MKVLFTKSVVKEVSKLSKEDRNTIYSYFNVLQNSQNPFAYGYSSLLDKLFDFFFLVKDYIFVSVVNKNTITIINILDN